MSRRALTLTVVAFAVIVLGLAAVFVPVPFVVLQPGPTANTLGTDGGTPLIQISGHQTYPTTGTLDLVTVTYQGGPGAQLDLLSALRGWLDPHSAVLPSDALFPPSLTNTQVTQQNEAEMTDSQKSAVTAALCQLKEPVTTAVKVDNVITGTPAEGTLKPGDQIIAIDGKAIGCADPAQMISGHAPGTPVLFTVERAGTRQNVTVRTETMQGRTVVGIDIEPVYHYPFTVKINLDGVGGPSAGLMFTLGIIDKLTPGDLTGGRAIAGTGTIDAFGDVGPIGGIQQKMVGARRDGATVFLAPADNCAEARRAVPDGLRLVKVTSLANALQVLQELRAGSPDLPTC